MPFNIIEIINEEILTTVANYPQFGDRLNSISEVDEETVGTFENNCSETEEDKNLIEKTKRI